MSPGDLAFVTLSINPIGGLLISIPFAVFKLGYPAWLAALAGIPLAYVQVIAVDLGWALLARIPGWHGFLERRRSPRVEKLLAARGGFWVTFVAAPLIGPWLVMAFMRYAQVPQRRVAVPILLGIGCAAMGLAGACVWAPRFVGR